MAQVNKAFQRFEGYEGLKNLKYTEDQQNLKQLNDSNCSKGFMVTKNSKDPNMKAPEVLNGLEVYKDCRCSWI